MSTPAEKKSVYEDLYDVPDHLIGQIIDGQLHTQPMPSPSHSKVTSDLGMVIGPPYRFGRGEGPADG